MDKKEHINFWYVALAILGMLLIQSLYRMHQERLGFTPQGLITFSTPIPLERRRTAAIGGHQETATGCDPVSARARRRRLTVLS